MRLPLLVASILILLAPAARASYVHFESGPVRPLAVSPDGSRLFATNISDNRLEIFAITPSGLRYETGVPVGLEPVAVAARTDGEVWVVNQLSDSVSIVDVASSPARVVRTLLLGDQPHDIAFAGPGGNRAFITSARRGQNSLVAPQLTTPGIGRANIWVYDALALGSEPAGAPLTIVTLFGDAPRALATSADGSKVYAAVFSSGNQTVGLNDLLTVPVEDFFKPFRPEIVLQPRENHSGDPAPHVGRIVKWDPATSSFRGPDVTTNWSTFIPFTLPDKDVFEIDANASPPVETDDYAHVGTVLFNMITNPTNGHLYVTNGDAKNETRFEGPGIFGSSTVRGRLHEYRITVIDPDGGSVEPIHLNKHIDYDLTPAQTETMGFRDHSLATPLEMAIREDGSKLYVAAFGSGVVGVFTPSQLEANSFAPSSADHIEISGGGPAGLVLDEATDRLYVYARFSNTISIVDVSSHPGTEIDVVPLAYNPEPEHVQQGRPFHYDARLTSSNGEASCSSCHIFANMDDLTWDLGNPDGDTKINNNVQTLVPLDLLLGAVDEPNGFVLEHHPMKGPMLTQSLRGLVDAGPMHWRGDRSGGQFREDPASLDPDLAFKEFNVAFEGLLARDAGPLSTAQMQAYTDFMLEVTYPPNPIRNLDNSLNTAQENGRAMFADFDTDARNGEGVPQVSCEDCHAHDVTQGFFGADGRSSFDGATQIFKIPHFRNLYARVGMFGQPQGPGFTPTGDQVRGTGFLHDGFVDTLFTFVGGRGGSSVFTFPGSTPAEREQQRRDLEQFLFAFDTNLLPIVGQQVTLGPGDPNGPLTVGGSESAHERIDLMRARAQVTLPRPECDLVVKGNVGGFARGWVMEASGDYTDDTGNAITDAALRALADVPGQELTFTCVYPGGGTRIGIDRNDDGILDGEQCGDVDDDAVPGEHDAALLRDELAGFAGVPRPDKCDVIGTGGACDMQDVVAIRRYSMQLGPGLAQLCPAAL